MRGKSSVIACWLLAGILAGTTTALGAGQGDQVVVVYNTRVRESKDIAEHYAALRQVPAAQLIALDLPDTEGISRDDFRDRLQRPLIKALESKKLIGVGPVIIPATNGVPQHIEDRITMSKIRYLMLCYGVPLHIAEDASLREEGTESMQAELKRNEAAVDSELACLPRLVGKMKLGGPIVNLLYTTTNAALLHPTNGILMVTRLDGPTPAIARGLVDKAVQAETDGLWGRAYFDLRGLTNVNYLLGDEWIRHASEVCQRLGFETVVDYNGATFPANFPLSQVAVYAGWYDQDISGPFARPTVEFMPGAFAYHLHSFSAAEIHGNNSRGWVGPLLARGVTATLGCVAEPYLVGTPDIGTIVTRFVAQGFTFGEAAYAGSEFLSWQTTVVGDPLYRPFGMPPQQRHDELEKRKSKLLEWSYLRAVNYRLASGGAPSDVIAILENLAATRSSPVLMEKLGELYSAAGKPSSSVSSLQSALKLEPSPQQRMRVMLTLAGRLVALNREGEAYEVYQEFLAKYPDYSDQLVMYRRLTELAEKLGKKEDAEKYQREISRLTAPPGQPGK